jgi:hypothetical protein
MRWWTAGSARLWLGGALAACLLTLAGIHGYGFYALPRGAID